MSNSSNSGNTTQSECHPSIPVKSEWLSLNHFGLTTRNRMDEHFVPTYSCDIHTHLRKLELEYSVSSDFLESNSVTPHIRTALVCWLVDVHSKFEFRQDTLYLCIDILDRYLEKYKTMELDETKLVGTTALCIAFKYEENNLLKIDDLVLVCYGKFNQNAFLKMERKMLFALEFKLGNHAHCIF